VPPFAGFVVEFGCSLRFDSGGMTAPIPALVSASRSQFASKDKIGREMAAGQTLDQRSRAAPVMRLFR